MTEHVYNSSLQPYGKGLQPVTAVGISLLLTVFMSFIVTAVNLRVGLAVTSLIFPITFLLCILMPSLLLHGRKALQSIAICIFLLICSVLFCGIFDDASYDGNGYHQKIAVLLLDGWNPFTDLDSDEAGVWATHYAKALEIAAASVISFTGNLESAKALNILLIIGCGCIFYTSITQYLPYVSKKNRFLISGAFILNPVGITQSLTFYTDFTKYYIILSTICLWLLIEKAERRTARLYTFALFCTIVFGISVKFNIFFEEGIAIICLIVWLIIRRQYQATVRITVIASVALLFSIAVVAYHPYITNYITNGNPLYPLLGENAADIMTGNTPAQFTHGRLYSFFASYFNPLSLPTYDARINGFGFAMPLLLIISGAVFIIYRKKIEAWQWYTLACIMISCFFFEQNWWARYLCQLWAVPCLAMIICINNRLFFHTFTALVTLTAIVASAIAIVSSARISIYRHYIYAECGNGTISVYNPSPSALRHLDEHGINYRISDTIPASGLWFYGSAYEDFSLIELENDAARRVIHQCSRVMPFNLSDKIKTQ